MENTPSLLAAAASVTGMERQLDAGGLASPIHVERLFHSNVLRIDCVCARVSLRR